MNRRHLLLLLLLAAVLFAGIAGAAQMSPGYNLAWHVVASGGGQSSSTSYVVNGTVGQSVAGPPQLSSASYAVTAGFWLRGNSVYLPTIVSH
jgi:hypothetical protein